ncbi:MAG: hypothetical protein MJE66_15280 [Proteobacteria bacterium]|nr:hypothetical protein [Pseudomonadota bacterium]
MNNLQPQLNPGTYLSSLRFTAGLNASPYGSVDTTVMRFEGSGAPEGTGLSQVTTAENGTVITVEKPGMYAVQLRGGNGAATPLITGVTVNADAFALTNPPNFGTAGTRDVDITEGPDAAGNAGSCALTSMVAVTAADIAAGTGGAQLRVHGSGGSIVVGTASLQVRRMGSIF